MTRSLTQSLKQKYLPILIKRDHGFICLYCKEPLTGEYIFEHLNGNRHDNRIENIVTSHQKCNIEKIESMEYQLMADEKLLQNEELGLHYLEDGTAHEQNSSLYNFHKKYISEQIAIEGRYAFNDAIAELPYLCQQRFGHGSEMSTRRYLKQLTNKLSDLQIIKDDKNKKWICKREVLN